uniref:Ureidopropionase, beta n=1 Tax=Hippocampus comes TaxID=109280 RepID=A0A3Q2Z1T0_HIPCM
MSAGQLESLERTLETYIPKSELKEVKRLLFGKETAILDLPAGALEAARQGDFELKGFSFEAAEEQLRLPRRIRVGLIQHHIVLPTEAPVLEQINAMHNRVGQIVEAAAMCGVNIICQSFKMQNNWVYFRHPSFSHACCSCPPVLLSPSLSLAASVSHSLEHVLKRQHARNPCETKTKRIDASGLVSI